MKQSKIKARVWVVERGKKRSLWDQIVTEEPLEIRLIAPQKTISITMRTPGADFDLAVGFLYTEGIINRKEDIVKLSYCLDSQVDKQQQYNLINIELKSNIDLNLKSLERHFFTNSSCGVCGKASIEALKIRVPAAIDHNQTLNPQVIYSLPKKLKQAQGIFTKTGGLHAAGLFDWEGKLIKLREDVGRHNALDKLIGSSVLADELSLSNQIVMVSGRTSFEIVQKCLTVGIPVICSISAPSSLAVDLAQEFNLTLIGFLRGDRFNVYSGFQRVIQPLQ